MAAAAPQSRRAWLGGGQARCAAPPARTPSLPALPEPAPLSPPPAALQGQFSLMDHRPVNEIVVDLMKEGYVPSWCTACYRKGARAQRGGAAPGLGVGVRLWAATQPVGLPVRFAQAPVAGCSRPQPGPAGG